MPEGARLKAKRAAGYSLVPQYDAPIDYTERPAAGCAEDPE
jgi:hypothetical protein